MSDVDPFGRKQGEDSLKEMGWTLPSSSPTPVAAPPAPTSAPSPSGLPSLPSSSPPRTPVTPTTVVRPRRTGGGGAVVARVIIPIVVLAGIGIGVGSAVSGVNHAVRGISFPAITIPQISIPTIPSITPSQPATPATPPTGLARGSLLRPAGLSAAIAKLRPLGARLSNLRVAPDRVNAQIVRGTTLRITQLSSAGALFRNDVANAGGSLTTYPWSQVNAQAPARMVRGAHRSASSVDYLVLFNFAGRLQWELYFKNGAHYSGDVAGRGAHRVG
jgi:hypothetical protein